MLRQFDRKRARDPLAPAFNGTQPSPETSVCKTGKGRGGEGRGGRHRAVSLFGLCVRLLVLQFLETRDYYPPWLVEPPWWWTRTPWWWAPLLHVTVARDCVVCDCVVCVTVLCVTVLCDCVTVFIAF